MARELQIGIREPLGGARYSGGVLCVNTAVRRIESQASFTSRSALRLTAADCGHLRSTRLDTRKYEKKMKSSADINVPSESEVRIGD